MSSTFLIICYSLCSIFIQRVCIVEITIRLNVTINSQYFLTFKRKFKNMVIILVFQIYTLLTLVFGTTRHCHNEDVSGLEQELGHGTRPDLPANQKAGISLLWKQKNYGTLWGTPSGRIKLLFIKIDNYHLFPTVCDVVGTFTLLWTQHNEEWTVRIK